MEGAEHIGIDGSPFRRKAIGWQRRFELQQGQSDGAVVANSQNPNQPKGVLRSQQVQQGLRVLNRTFLLTVAFWRSVTWSRAWARSLSLPSLKVAGCKRSRWAKADWSLTVTFSPDGRLAVVFDYRLWFVRIDDGKKMPTKIQAESVVFSPDGRWMVADQRQFMSIYDANGHLVKEIQSNFSYHI
jgi:hypothetical protein